MTDIPAKAGKLGLGTAQFGMNYGIANASGKIAETAIDGILDYCRHIGVRAVDTASAYGDSESVLGRHLPRGGHFDVITKTIPLAAPEVTDREIATVQRAFDVSLERLGLSCVYAVLVHNAENLLGPGAEMLFDLLQRWKRAGLARKIGASVYDGEQIRRLTARYQLDIVQLPLNVFDQRLVRDGTLTALRSAGIEVHARSVFLQGLLLMREDQLPASLQKFAAHVSKYRGFLSQLSCTQLEAALGFVKHLPEVDVAVIGIDSERHLRECAAAYERARPLDYASFASDSPDFVDPRRWGKN